MKKYEFLAAILNDPSISAVEAQRYHKLLHEASGSDLVSSDYQSAFSFASLVFLTLMSLSEHRRSLLLNHLVQQEAEDKKQEQADVQL